MQSLALLSGGEQTKVKLAELMMQTSNLLFLDEPTNHIDEAAKKKFTRSNSRFPGTVFLVSRKQIFMRKLWIE